MDGRESSVVELIVQLVTHGAAYNPIQQKWQELGNTTYVITVNPKYRGSSTDAFKDLYHRLPVVKLFDLR